MTVYVKDAADARILTDPHVKVAGDDKLVSHIYTKAAGDARLVFQRQRGYLLRQAGTGGLVQVYQISGNRDALTFTALTNTLNPAGVFSQNNAVLVGASVFDGRTWLIWNLQGFSVGRLQVVTIDEDGITGGDVYNGPTNTTGSSIPILNSTMHILGSDRTLKRITLDDGDTSFTVAVVQVSGSLPFGPGAAVHTSNTVYIAGNDAATPRKLMMARLSNTFEFTTLTSVDENGDAVDVEIGSGSTANIEAALAIGDIFIFLEQQNNHLARGRIWR